jgi:hypothetical protein
MLAGVARAFVEDMRAFFAEPDAIKRDEIAARQLHALRQHHTGKLRLFDVKQMFLQMKDFAARARSAVVSIEAPVDALDERAFGDCLHNIFLSDSSDKMHPEWLPGTRLMCRDRGKVEARLCRLPL